MTQVTHLLVDLDGTLVDGDHLLTRISFVLRMTQTWPHLGGFFKTFRALYRMQLAAESRPNGETNDLRIIKSFANTFQIGEAEAQKLLENSLHQVFPTLSHFFSPVSGAAEFLDWAKEHYPLILATNPIWNEEAVALRVKWAGLELRTFSSFTHAKRMHACKPHREYYQELMDQEGLDPTHCLLIGNDPRKDLPARELGIRVFLVTGKRNAITSLDNSHSFQKRFGSAWQGTYRGLRDLLEEDLLRQEPKAGHCDESRHDGSTEKMTWTHPLRSE